MQAQHITPPIALTIAGSDSGGGAGIQADLRAFMAFRVHGCSALSCVTAQNTCGVIRVDPIPPEGLKAQLQAVQTEHASLQKQHAALAQEGGKHAGRRPAAWILVAVCC